MKKKTKIKLFLLSALILLNIVMNLFGNALQVEHYSLASDKLTKPVRIVFITDLHNCTYGGADQSGLWTNIQAEDPDLILFGGDVIDWQGGTEHALQLMRLVRDVYPCAYAAGNHEGMREDSAAFYGEVEALGIPVLHGAYTDIEISEQKFRICGLIDAVNHPEQLKASCESADPERYSILLAHQPEQLDDITAECAGKPGFDLVLSGHAHGGQWRIPMFAEQGLYAPDQGVFPVFTGGMRQSGSTVQIVSRGLAKPLRMILIPRICNRPELSVVDISPV